MILVISIIKIHFDIDTLLVRNVNESKKKMKWMLSQIGTKKIQRKEKVRDT